MTFLARSVYSVPSSGICVLPPSSITLDIFGYEQQKAVHSGLRKNKYLMGSRNSLNNCPYLLPPVSLIPLILNPPPSGFCASALPLKVHPGLAGMTLRLSPVALSESLSDVSYQYYWGLLVTFSLIGFLLWLCGQPPPLVLLPLLADQSSLLSVPCSLTL